MDWIFDNVVSLFNRRVVLAQCVVVAAVPADMAAKELQSLK